MFAQNLKKGLVCFLFLSMLLILVTCSTNNPSEPGGQVVSSSSSNGGNSVISSSSEAVISSSSEEEVISSSSEDEISSDSAEEDSSSSEVADSSSSEAAITSSSSEVAGSSSSVAAASSSSRATSSSSRAASSSSVAASSSSRAASSSSVVAISSSSRAASSSSVAGSNTPPTAAERAKREIAYVEGGHSRQKLDLTLPSTGDGPFPVVIFIHGGAFMAGTKADVSAPMDKATSHGYALASLGYRLSNDGGSFPNSVKDLTAGIRFLRANAAKYHLDPNKFALSGCSAGSYYTALLAAISGGGHNFDDAALGNSGVSSAVQVAACSSALTDIELLDDHQAINTGVRYSFDHETANSPEATYIGASLVPSAVASNATTKEKLRLANPLTYVTTEHCAGIAPILMMHAQDDNLLPWQQSQILVDKMNQVCGAGKAEMDKLASGGHCKFSSEKKIFDYIDAVLKK